MAQADQFPGPEPSDPEDVAWTLTTAGTMWARGELHEAVRWLRRAAEAAGDSGNDLRAVSLARAAADLTSTIGQAPSQQPPASPADQTSRMAVPPISRPDNPRPIQPVEDADGKYDTSDYTIPEGLPAVEPPPFRPPPMPARPIPSRPAPPPPARAGSAQSDKPLPKPSRPPVTPMTSRNAPPPMTPAIPGPSRPSQRPPPSQRPSSIPPAAMGVRQRQTLRVAVEPSADERNLLLCRPLAEDEPVPPGMHEALLTALEPGSHLLTRKR